MNLIPCPLPLIRGRGTKFLDFRRKIYKIFYFTRDFLNSRPPSPYKERGTGGEVQNNQNNPKIHGLIINIPNNTLDFAGVRELILIFARIARGLSGLIARVLRILRVSRILRILIF